MGTNVAGGVTTSASSNSATQHPEVGLPVEELDTPALCIDLDAFEANVADMAAFCRERHIDWRPHSKAHKSPEIAKREIAAGALGVTCAKLGEAEVMAAGGVRDILIANQIAGPAKIRRLVALRKIADPIVAVDHELHLCPLSEAAAAAGVKVRVLIEVNVGLDRAGVQPGEPTMALARLADELPGVELAGIMGYEGHLLTLEDPQHKVEQIRAAMDILRQTHDDLLAAGLPCPIVSAGGTGSYAITGECPGITELQAGGLVFMDAFYRKRCNITAFRYALKLYVTVVSRPTPERAIIDAGRKTHHVDNQPSFVVGYEDTITVKRLSAEHGELTLAPAAQHLQIGDRLEIIPGYSDMTNVMHNQFYAIRNGHVEAVWPLVGRGHLR